MKDVCDLAVVIVTWNVRDLICQALDTILADLSSTSLSWRLLVVDSASSDDTADLVATNYPQIELTASKENLGFGRSNNLALRQLGFGDEAATELPKAVFLLNPDTITVKGATGALYEVLFSAPDIGLVGAHLSYEDGSFQHSAFQFPGLRQIWSEFFPIPGRWREGEFNGRYPRHLYSGNQPFPVDFTLGATMMLRREVVQQTGMFDEGFFMYCEEIDWAWRMHRAGWRVMCVPTARIVHLSGKSTGQVRPRAFKYLWESRLRLFEKYYPPWKLWIARRLVRNGVQSKLGQLERSNVPEKDGLSIRDAYKYIIELATK